MKIGGNGWGKALWRHVSSDFMKDFLGFFPVKTYLVRIVARCQTKINLPKNEGKKLSKKTSAKTFGPKNLQKRTKKTLLTLNICLMWRSETTYTRTNGQKKIRLLTNLIIPHSFFHILFSFSKKCQGFRK